MDSKYKFSFIVPVYKVEYDFLRKCIESILKQDYDDYEVILVDDGSPDDCGKICDEYSEKYNNVKVIHQENQGVSVARNNGISNSQGKWIVFVDGDDWTERYTLKKLDHCIRSYAQNAEIILFEYSRDFKDGNFKHEYMPIEEGYLSDEMLKCIKRAPFHKLIINGKSCEYSLSGVNTKAYLREFILLNKLKFIPEARKGQDRLFNAEALIIAKKVYYMKERLFHYNCYLDSVTNRYNENIISLTNLELNTLFNLINKYNLDDTFKEYLNVRTITRLYSCLRLYFFNKNYRGNYFDAKKNFKELLKSSPYNTAINNINFSLLNKSEKIFIISIKLKMFYLLKILVSYKARKLDKKL